MEKAGLGLRVIFAGKDEAAGDLWPPQAGKSRNKGMMATTDAH
jgi:hypothetical protein